MSDDFNVVVLMKNEWNMNSCSVVPHQVLHNYNVIGTIKRNLVPMLSFPSSEKNMFQKLSSLISNCVTAKSLKHGKAIHSQLIKTALFFDVFLANGLIDLYSKCCCKVSVHKAFDDLPNKTTRSWNTLLTFYSKNGIFDQAYKLFDKMPQKNLVSFNSLISGVTRHGFHEQAVNMFRVMQRGCGGLMLDEFTLVSIVSNCSSLGNVKWLHQVHGVAVIVGFNSNLILNNAFIDAYGKCGESNMSFRLFHSMLEKDVVSWTSMVVTYTRASRIDDACKVFNEMPVKNTVSWTALITGFVKNRRYYEALKVCHQMIGEGVMPSAQTFVSVLDACASEALIERGKQVHSQIIRGRNNGNLFNAYVCNALIDMYAKCGDMKSAETLFEMMIHVRDVVSWNTLITGFAQNGCGKDSLAVFSRMMEANIEPNHVTFLAVLSACNHAGLVNEGLELLDLMERQYKVKPKRDHYALLIDLLGRKNRLKEAICLIEKGPDKIKNHIAIWGAILGSCRVHGNLELAKKAAEALFVLEPENTGRYVMLSNIYAASGKWCDANKIRNVMKERGLMKEAACSWIELKNSRCGFVAKDNSHPQIGEIHEVNSKLVLHLMDAGYQPYLSYPSLLVEDDDFYFS